MKAVLVDTSVWSLAFRRKEGSVMTNQLGSLILANMVVMVGPVRQELLSGISDEAAFNKLRDRLMVFDDISINIHDYITAARFYNICRKNGIQGSHTDFLICAVAHNNNLSIYTTDMDFEHYAKFLPIELLGGDGALNN